MKSKMNGNINNEGDNLNDDINDINDINSIEFIYKQKCLDLIF